MGRTLPSMMMLIEAERAQWSAFRRGLRREDQALFDRLWSAVRYHAAAAAYVANALPFETFLFSMLIEQERRIEALERYREVASPKHALTGPPSSGTL